MRLEQLPAVDFVKVDADDVMARMLNQYKDITGRRLADGDPVRLFILTIANEVTLLYNAINETGRQNLLAYARGDNLDHIGALVGVTRLEATPAVTTVRVTLSAKRERDTLVPKGARVTAGDNVFFAFTKDTTILAGGLTADIPAECLTVGTRGNGYAKGELSTLTDPVPYVDTVTNITATAGGDDRETDDNFRARIALAPESFSVAGPVGAYEYHAKRASALISDVVITSPVPGDVVIYPLLKGGALPESEVLQEVDKACNARSVRPLTDHVTTKAPTAKKYDINIKYFISEEDAGREQAIKTAVGNAVADFIAWQKARIGRDINPDELIRRVMIAGAKRVEVTAPVFTRVKNGRESDAYAVEVAVASEPASINYGGLEYE